MMTMLWLAASCATMPAVRNGIRLNKNEENTPSQSVHPDPLGYKAEVSLLRRPRTTKDCLGRNRNVPPSSQPASQRGRAPAELSRNQFHLPIGRPGVCPVDNTPNRT